MSTLGKKLRLGRQLNGLSLRGAEKVTGISNAYLSQLENGKIKHPSPHFLHKLSMAYGLEYELLMEASGYLLNQQVVASKREMKGVLFGQKLSQEEEIILAEYLAFMRSRTGHKPTTRRQA